MFFINMLNIDMASDANVSILRGCGYKWCNFIGADLTTCISDKIAIFDGTFIWDSKNKIL
jgi:hypothetical protein